MNKKHIAVILILGVIIIAGLSFFFLMNKTQDSTSEGNDHTDNSDSYSTGGVLSSLINYDGKEFLPQKIQVLPMNNVVFKNNTKVPLVIKYDDNTLPATLVLPNSTTKSPSFIKKGNYQYYATNNTDISGFIEVK